MFKYVLLILLGGLMFVNLSCTSTEPKNMNILIITGGHKFEEEAFFAMFESIPDLNYTEAVQPEANNLYASSSIEAYDAIVFYDMVQEISDEQQTAMIDLLNKGKGMVFLHTFF